MQGIPDGNVLFKMNQYIYLKNEFSLNCKKWNIVKLAKYRWTLAELKFRVKVYISKALNHHVPQWNSWGRIFYLNMNDKRTELQCFRRLDIIYQFACIETYE